jgi:DNA-binding NarL/FixJ family response regulator
MSSATRRHSSCVLGVIGFVDACCLATKADQRRYIPPSTAECSWNVRTIIRGRKTRQINAAGHAFSKRGRRQTRDHAPPTKVLDIGERFAALSRRQQQVVSLVCNGLTNKMTADKLGVNEGTIKSHLHAIYEGRTHCKVK